MYRAGLERGSPEYEKLKDERSQVLWRAVEQAIPDIRQRTEVEMVGASLSPFWLLELPSAACTCLHPCATLCMNPSVDVAARVIGACAFYCR